MDRARLLSTLLPPGVSLLIHLALLIVVAAVSITAVTLTQDDDTGSDIVLTLDNPAPAAPPPAPLQTPTEAFEALAPSTLTTPASASDLTVPSIVQEPIIAAPPAIMARPRLDTRRAVAPGAAFAGLRADRVRRVVYVVDVSGPMTSSLQFVFEELLRSVSRLDASQYFQVVLFRDPQEAADTAGADPGYITLSPPSQAPRLLPANPANRAALAEFLGSMRPGGRSNPLAGLRVALALEPDAIFLLARGISRTGPNARWGEGQQVILDTLNALNPADSSGRRQTAIKTIQFIDDDPTGLMQAIAEIHGQAGQAQDAQSGATASASYSRRNVEDLQRSADIPAESIIELPDPAIDRAASILWDLTAHRLDLSVLFTAAGEADRDRVRRDAGAALEALATAAPDAVEDELGRLMRARATLLRAAATAPDARRPLLDQVLETLDTSDGAPPEVLGTAACARALRRATGDADAAELLARRAIEPDPNSLAALESRLAAITALADDPARLEPWLADLNAAMSRRPFLASGRLDAPLALLALNASAHARLTHARTPDAINAALAQHLEWHAAPRPGLPAEAVLTAAGELLPADAPLDQLDPRLALGRGLSLLPSPGQQPSAECLRALDIAASHPAADASTAESASIRAAMGVSLWAAALPQTVETGLAPRQDAVARLDRALEHFPSRAWQRDAALHLTSHTATLLGLGTTDDSIATPRLRALNVLVLTSPRPDPRADAWRLELARRIADSTRDLPAPRSPRSTGPVEPPPADPFTAIEDTALQLLEGPWHERPARDIDRVSAWILSRRVARLADLIMHAQDAHDTSAQHAHATAMAEAARRAITHAQPIAPEAADALRADLAEALIVLKSPEASEIYADLRARHITLGRSDSFMTLAHARALLAQGDSPGAFTLLRDLTRDLPTPHPDDPDTFWHAWCLTLELLTQQVARTQDDSARRSASAHLLRLHTLDPMLGGEPWSSRLHAAALSVGVALPDAVVHSEEPVLSPGS